MTAGASTRAARLAADVGRATGVHQRGIGEGAGIGARRGGGVSESDDAIRSVAAALRAVN